MPLPRNPRTAPEKQVMPDIEVVPVTRLEIVFDTGVGLSFDLEKEDSVTDAFGDGTQMLITLGGKRVITIAKSRILYTEQRPAELKRIKPAL